MTGDSMITLDGEKEAFSMNNEAYGTERNGGSPTVRTAITGYAEASQTVPVDSSEQVPVDEDKGVTSIVVNRADIDKSIKDELGKGCRMIQDDDRTPQVGMFFNSYEEVVNFYKRYALRVGFGVAVRKSSFTTDGLCRRLVLVCTKGGSGRANDCYQSRPTAKTNCQALIIVKLWGDGLLHLVEAVLEHNHPVNPSAARFLRCYKKMSGGMAKDFRPRGQQGNLQDGDKESLNLTGGDHLELQEGDNELIYQFFAQMQAKNPNFFYLMDTDLDGHLRNVFWADARSRTAYQYFHDVIYFDTTYIKNKFDVPLVLFIGVNHHGQRVLVGCGLLSKETPENYVWLLKTWLTCMLGQHPNSIITDYSKTIEGAVAEVLPGVHYRVSLWHVLDNIQQKLMGFADSPEFNKELEKLAYNSLKVDYFEENWERLVERYGFDDNEWLISLYEVRHYWVPVYLKDTFWAGLHLTERKKSIEAFFDECLYLRTSLKELFTRYEIFLQGKYELETQTDFETFHKSQILVSKFPMEEQLSTLYTPNIFKNFQDELMATVHCHVLLVKIEGPISRFQVKECAYRGEVEEEEKMDFDVIYNAESHEVQCICGSFQSGGILCRHSLSVFKLQQVYEIPPQYIFIRWRKDFERCHALAHPPNDAACSNNVMERYDYLTKRCLHLANYGVISNEKYRLALKLISEVEKSLLDDNTLQVLKRRFLSSETRSNGSDENHVASQFGLFGCNKNRNTVQVKRRGRPPKKRKEPNMDTFISNNEKDYLGTAVMGSPSDVIQSPSSASHLGSHMQTYGNVDRMEEINPNELSFGSHFGANINHPHHVGSQTVFGQQALGSQSRMQWIYQQMLQEDQTPFGRKTA